MAKGRFLSDSFRESARPPGRGSIVVFINGMYRWFRVIIGRVSWKLHCGHQFSCANFCIEKNWGVRIFCGFRGGGGADLGFLSSLRLSLLFFLLARAGGLHPDRARALAPALSLSLFFCLVFTWVSPASHHEGRVKSSTGRGSRVANLLGRLMSESRLLQPMDWAKIEEDRGKQKKIEENRGRSRKIEEFDVRKFGIIFGNVRV